MTRDGQTDGAPLAFDLGEVAFDGDGLVPVVAQEARDGTVLMLAWADREALRRTADTGQGHYWSRSRGELWRKGATSGSVQRVVEMRLDCDGDAVLYRVEQTGPACHTGERSCFHRPQRPGPASAGASGILALLEGVVDERLERLPEGSYVTRLHDRGVGYVAQKVIEEAGEAAVAAVQGDEAELPGEAADLLFHLTVLLRERGISFADVAEVLDARHRRRAGGVDGTS